MQTHQHSHSVTQQAHVVVDDIFSDRQTYEKRICKHEVQIKHHVETPTVFCVYNICNVFCTYMLSKKDFTNRNSDKKKEETQQTPLHLVVLMSAPSIKSFGMLLPLLDRTI